MTNDKRLTIQEELAIYGGGRLEAEDLLTILIGINTEKAKELIQAFGNINKVISNLDRIDGLTIPQKSKLEALKELDKRLNIVEYKSKIKSPDMIYNEYKKRYLDLEVEHFDILLLDTKNQIINILNISVGTINASIVHPREVFKEAIRLSANSVILLHNHPTGDPSPSSEDINITNRLVDGGNILGIKVLDHIIFGQDQYISFKEKNLI